MKRLHLLTTLLAALLLASCGTSARLARAGAPQREQLSRQLGIPIGKRDNIALYAEAASWLGTPYRYGGTTRNGIDCSALVGNIYRSVYRRTLSRSAQDIARNDCRRKQIRTAYGKRHLAVEQKPVKKHQHGTAYHRLKHVYD